LAGRTTVIGGLHVHRFGRTANPAASKTVAPPSRGEKPVIGNDLKIIVQELKIIGRGTLQIERDIRLPDRLTCKWYVVALHNEIPDNV